MKLFSPDSRPGCRISNGDVSFNRRGQIRHTVKTSGQNANISGRICEKSLILAFEERGVSVLPYRKQVGDLLVDRVLYTNVPYISMCGTKSRSEAVYHHGRGGLSVRFECRAQQSSGSVDEKFPYLLGNAKLVEETAVWLVLGGGGARPEFVEWLKYKAHNYSRKIIRVYTENEARVAVRGLVEEGIADALPRDRRNRKTRYKSHAPVEAGLFL